ncbi:MAG TPA: hypothetical protein VMW52_01560, partial [Phycisphaerae bacterium]|nr:hypothetical protein [Phycisphaerae bacterium]
MTGCECESCQVEEAAAIAVVDLRRGHLSDADYGDSPDWKALFTEARETVSDLNRQLDAAGA